MVFNLELSYKKLKIYPPYKYDELIQTLITHEISLETHAKKEKIKAEGKKVITLMVESLEDEEITKLIQQF